MVERFQHMHLHIQRQMERNGNKYKFEDNTILCFMNIYAFEFKRTQKHTTDTVKCQKKDKPDQKKLNNSPPSPLKTTFEFQAQFFFYVVI